MHIKVAHAIFNSHHENVVGNDWLYHQHTTRWNRCQVKLKSRHNFVRRTMIHSSRAPTRELRINVRMTPAFDTWTCWKVRVISLGNHCQQKNLTLYSNNWSNTKFSPDTTSTTVINTIALRYRRHCNAAICEIWKENFMDDESHGESHPPFMTTHSQSWSDQISSV